MSDKTEGIRSTADDVSDLIEDFRGKGLDVTTPGCQIGPVTIGPFTVPAFTLPPVTIGPFTVPAFTLPPVTFGPFTVPAFTLPPVTFHVSLGK